MTTPPPADDPIRDAVMRLVEQSRAIDPKLALAGIRANRSIRRNHNHSVRHRAYR